MGEFPTKTEILSARGEPHEINRTDNSEVWIYYVDKNRWCGVVPAWIFVVPLLLPLCDEYDRYTFVGEEGRKAESVRMATSGAIVVMPMMQGGGHMEHRCPLYAARGQNKPGTDAATQPADRPSGAYVTAAPTTAESIAPAPTMAAVTEPVRLPNKCDDATSEIRLKALCVTADGCREQIEAMRSHCPNGNMSSCETSWQGLRFCERSSSAYNEATCATAIGRVRAYCADY